ncbi:MAG: hypothetical protein IH946_05430, partial [Bacteroidetes bacterium]|nr:hypothetical protein [Bacteroidota bacterium]
MENNLKIFLANHRYFFSGGPERYMFNISNKLEEKGSTVVPFSVQHPQNKETPYEGKFLSALSSNSDAVYFDQMKKTPAVINKIVSRMFYSRESYRTVDTLCKEEQFDIAY